MVERSKIGKEKSEERLKEGFAERTEREKRDERERVSEITRVKE